MNRAIGLLLMAACVSAHAVVVDAVISPTAYVVRDGGQLRLKVAFEYDEGLIIFCREFRGYYKPELSAWLLPIQHKEDAERRQTQLKETGAVRSIQSEASAASTPERAAAGAAASSVPPTPQRATPPLLRLPPTLAEGLMPHQREAVEFVVGNGLRGLVADDMGLGKTVTAIGVLAHADVWPALVLCPASVKYNWRAELLRWLPEQLSAARVQVVDAGKEPISADARVLIETYDGARTRAANGELARFRAIVCDESHNLKTPEVRRTATTHAPCAACASGCSGFSSTSNGTHSCRRPRS